MAYHYSYSQSVRGPADRVKPKLSSHPASEVFKRQDMKNVMTPQRLISENYAASPKADTPRGLQQGTLGIPKPLSVDETETDSTMMEQEMEARNLKLVPVEINFRLRENRIAHRTEEYEIQGLVLRRGQVFQISIRFDKPYISAKHKISLQFTIGTRSLISKGTHIRIPVNGVSLIAGWSAQTIKPKDKEELDERSVLIEVTTPPDAFTGRYKTYLETQIEDEKPYLFRYADEILLIFNPWCQNDACYMKNEDEIKEYVMNEEGIIFTGSDSKIIPKKWYFGQFEFPCLEIALWLLERANLPYESRGEPSHVTRALAAMINGGDRGMLMTYKPGSPTQGFQAQEWAGSVKIVKRFMEQRGQPVRYGACWTFAAVLCTMTRALGIPCRVVTCFKAGHDCDINGTIDIHWDKNHRPIRALNKDVVWTYHAWNEFWFKRSDIPENLNGWEAVDSTSNAASESLYRLGPCPVKAIKTGNLAVLYDTPYIAAAANGYLVHWLVGSSGEMSPIGMEENSLGTAIMTKGVLNDNAVDIAADYKYEKDIKGIWPTFAARKQKITNECQQLHKNDDVSISLVLPQETTLGDTIVFTWMLKNNSKSSRTCEFYMNSFFASYDGIIFAECKEVRGETDVLAPESEKQHLTKIRAEDYMDRYKPNYLFKVYLQVHVVETGQILPIIKDVGFDVYDMLKLIPESTIVELGKPFLLRVQISNPLKRILQNCSLHMEGVGIPRTVVLERPIRPLETTVYQTHLTPTRPGKRTFFVTFSSSLLTNVQKTINLEIVSGDPRDDLEEQSASLGVEEKYR